MLADIRCCRSVGSSNGGFENLIQLILIDTFEFGAIRCSKNCISDVTAYEIGDTLGDTFFCSKYCLCEHVLAICFLMGVSSRRDLWFNFWVLCIRGLF